MASAKPTKGHRKRVINQTDNEPVEAPVNIGKDLIVSPTILTNTAEEAEKEEAVETNASAARSGPAANEEIKSLQDIPKMCSPSTILR